MALIRKMSEIRKDRQSVHQEVECAYFVFEIRGHKYLQIETFGSPTRKMAGTTSQTMQFDEESLRELKTIVNSVLS